MDNQKMVERFEEAFLDGKSRDDLLVFTQLNRGADGQYFNFNTRVMFNWFAKGAASVVVELPKPYGPDRLVSKAEIHTRLMALDECGAAIEAAGGKVKS